MYKHIQDGDINPGTSGDELHNIVLYKKEGTYGSVVVKTLCYKPEVREFETQ
jgi:hypothetical protein